MNGRPAEEPTGPIHGREITCYRCGWEWPDESYYWPKRKDRSRPEMMCRCCYNERATAAKGETPSYISDNIIHMLETWGGASPDRVEHYLSRLREIRGVLGIECDDIDPNAPITNPEKYRRAGTAPPVTEYQIKRSMSLFQQGMPIEMIADRIELPVGTIVRLAKERGIKHPNINGGPGGKPFLSFENAPIRTFRMASARGGRRTIRHSA